MSHSYAHHSPASRLLPLLLPLLPPLAAAAQLPCVNARPRRVGAGGGSACPPFWQTIRRREPLPTLPVRISALCMAAVGADVQGRKKRGGRRRVLKR